MGIFNGFKKKDLGTRVAITPYTNTTDKIGLAGILELFSGTSPSTTFAMPCILYRANAVGTTKFNVVNKSGAEYRKDILNLINNPNPYNTLPELLTSLVYQLDYHGNAFILATKKLNEVINLQLIPFTKVETELTTYNDIVYTIDDKKYNSKDIIHIKHPSLTGGYLGDPLHTSIKSHIQTNNLVNQFMISYVGLLLTNPMYAKVPEQMHADQWERLKVSFQQKTSSMNLWFLAENGLEVDSLLKQFTENPSSVISNYSKEIKQNISAIYGVTLAMLTGEYANRATAEQQEKTFQLNTANKLRMLIADGFTQFFQQYDAEIVIEPVLYEYIDSNYELQAQKQRIELGLTNRNEERALLGLEPIPDGDTYLLTSSLSNPNANNSQETSLSKLFKKKTFHN